MSKEEKPQKEKKIVFSEEIDGKISGFAVALAFIAVGVLLVFDGSYFGNETVSTIVRWVFIIVGTGGLLVYILKIGKGDIKGIGNFALGVLFIAIWLVLYLKPVL